MIVGVPKEVKTDEYRVAMIPVGVEELTRAGNKVLMQAGAGQGSGISDDQYAQNGAEIVVDAVGSLFALVRPLGCRVRAGASAARRAALAGWPPRTLVGGP